jgi:hypothetical protein
MQSATLTLSELARICSGPIYGAGTVLQYSVNGLPHGHEALIWNEQAVGVPACWKIRYRKDGRSGDWTGGYATAEEALRVVELVARCYGVSENARSLALEADQARQLVEDWFEMPKRYRAIADQRTLSAKKKVCDLQAEILQRKMADFLSATREL